jgi:cell wall-associated NlpC family hydrolase
MNSKSLKTLAVSLTLAGIMTGTAGAASIGGATVNVPDLNFRTGAGADTSVFTTVSTGTVVVVGEKVNGNWYKVVYRGTVGYMSADYLNFSESLDGDFGSGTIHGSSVRLRSAPDIASNTLGTYDHGTKMAVLGVSGSWYKVSLNGVTGYVHSDYLALNGGIADFQGASAQPSDEGQLIVETAMKYLGTPYVWGGTSTSGFDCSGLVYYVYKECGYSINRTAASIYQNGVYVEKSDLKPGDPVCFSSSSSSIGHVGIYIGNGQFIHSSSSAGGVIITDLDTDYYVRNYVGARRII